MSDLTIYVTVSVVCVTMVFTGALIHSAVRNHTDRMVNATLRAGLVVRFPGPFTDAELYAVVDNKRAYFLRDGALWVAVVENGVVVKRTEHALNLVTARHEMIQEAVNAVDALNSRMKHL